MSKPDTRSPSETAETPTPRVQIDPEDHWRYVWHRRCPKRGPMKRLADKHTLGDGSVLCAYECLMCGVKCFAGLDAQRRVVTRQYPSGADWPAGISGQPKQRDWYFCRDCLLTFAKEENAIAHREATGHTFDYRAPTPSAPAAASETPLSLELRAARAVPAGTPEPAARPYALEPSERVKRAMQAWMDADMLDINLRAKIERVLEAADAGE